MACFTTEHVLQIVPYAKCCKVGDDIWMMGETDDYNDVMRRFDTKAKTCENIEYNKASSDPFWDNAWNNRRNGRRYSIFTSDGQLYMCSTTAENDSRLLKFNPSTLEWKRLVDFRASINNRVFIMIEREMYMTPEYTFMQILDLDTAQMTSVQFPESKGNCDYDHYNICELNGMIYLIAILRPWWRSVYQYDNAKFIDIKKNDRMPWAVEQYGNHLSYMDTFAWSNNNKIYQAFAVHKRESNNIETIIEYLVIDCFDVESEKWHTVFQSKYDKGVKNILGGSDNIYIMSENTVYVDIREINLTPDLQNISLIQLADISVGNYYTKNYEPLTTKLPIGLRATYNNVVSWKLQDTPMGLLEHKFNLIEKCSFEKNALEARRIELEKKFEAGSYTAQHLSEDEKLVEALLRTNDVLRRETWSYNKLREEHKWVLKLQNTGCLNGRREPYSKYQFAKLKELGERFRSLQIRRGF